MIMLETWELKSAALANQPTELLSYWHVALQQLYVAAHNTALRSQHVHPAYVDPTPCKHTHAYYRTHSFWVMSSYPCCSLRPWYTNDGPHQARAPATNDTHVKPAVDNMKLLLQTKTVTGHQTWFRFVWKIPRWRNCFMKKTLLYTFWELSS
jgi:hypothetical protein